MGVARVPDPISADDSRGKAARSSPGSGLRFQASQRWSCGQVGGGMAAAGSAEAQLVQHRMQQSGQDDADDLDDLSLAWKRAGEVTPRPLADGLSR